MGDDGGRGCEGGGGIIAGLTSFVSASFLSSVAG